MTPSLPTIIALARSGALDRAWERFQDAGFDQELADPRVLSVKGRLLKDRALRSAGADRQRCYHAAADAYRAAAALDQATYPLINAATLSLLAGQAEQARDLAGDVLARIAAHPDEPETPYYKAATIAEALLLRGQQAEARGQLVEAVRLAPQAWEDHASTLRQFALILAAQGVAAGWLDALRPPRSLHFAGHMSFEAGQDQAALRAEVTRLLDAERIGFGFGALAAGADIIIAEALVAAGAELHAILPGGADAFAARSVEPFGADWRARFDALIERAETVRAVRPVDVLPGPAMICAADNVAMGHSILQARRLESEALQLLILPDRADPAPVARSSEQAQKIWAARGLRQHVLHISRQTPHGDDRGDAVPAAGQRWLATLAIGGREGAALAPDPLPELLALRDQVGDAALALPPFWSGQQLILAFAGLADAVAMGLRLMGAGWPVGGDLLVCTPYTDPFTASLRLPSVALAPLEGTAASVLPGMFQATEDFAAVLAVQAPGSGACESIGELEAAGMDAPIGLFSVRPAS